MKLESVGIIVSLAPFGERDAVARIFTADYGVMAGMLKGAAVARRRRPLVGQYGNVSWNARLESQLGTFHFEPLKNLIAPLMSNPESLNNVNSAFNLITALLPERADDAQLFDSTIEFLQTQDYLKWQILFLESIGYALDISSCGGCGTKDDLKFIYKKTGRTVCGVCGAPYADQIFPLPITTEITEYFIERAKEV